MGHLTCYRCWRRCSIPEGGVGECRAVGNVGGRASSLAYGRPSTVAVGPIEDKLFHFYPGSKVLSVGGFGCNLRCCFCQNHDISQSSVGLVDPLGAGGFQRIVDEHGADSVAFTYSEPLVMHDYVVAVFSAVRTKRILKTSGFVSRGVMAEVVDSVDAINFDFKGGRGRLGQMCGVAPEAVDDYVANVKLALEAERHVEATVLVYGGALMSGEERDLLFEAFPYHVPIQIMPVVPDHRYDGPLPTREELEGALEDLSRTYSHVYVKAPWAENDTSCPGCGRVTTRRKSTRLLENDLVGGTCPDCGHKVLEDDTIASV